jgi:hypothetical protein
MIFHGFADVTQPGELRHLALERGGLQVNVPGSGHAG